MFGDRIGAGMGRVGALSVVGGGGAGGGGSGIDRGTEGFGGGGLEVEA